MSQLSILRVTAQHKPRFPFFSSSIGQRPRRPLAHFYTRNFYFQVKQDIKNRSRGGVQLRAAARALLVTLFEKMSAELEENGAHRHVNERAAAGGAPPKVYEIDHANTGFGVDFQVLRRCAPPRHSFFICYRHERRSFPQKRDLHFYNATLNSFISITPKHLTKTKELVFLAL